MVQEKSYWSIISFIVHHIGSLKCWFSRTEYEQLKKKDVIITTYYLVTSGFLYASWPCQLTFPVAIWEQSLNLNTSAKWPHVSLLKDQSTGAIYCQTTGLPCAIQVLQGVLSSCFIWFLIFKVWKLFLLWTNFGVFLNIVLF